MKIILSLLLLVSILFGQDRYKVLSYDGVDINNFGGQRPLSSSISEIIITDYYISLRGMKNKKQIGKSYTIIKINEIEINNIIIKQLIVKDNENNINFSIMKFSDKITFIDINNDIYEVYTIELF